MFRYPWTTFHFCAPVAKQRCYCRIYNKFPREKKIVSILSFSCFNEISFLSCNRLRLCFGRFLTIMRQVSNLSQIGPDCFIFEKRFSRLHFLNSSQGRSTHAFRVRGGTALRTPCPFVKNDVYMRINGFLGAKSRLYSELMKHCIKQKSFI